MFDGVRCRYEPGDHTYGITCFGTNMRRLCSSVGILGSSNASGIKVNVAVLGIRIRRFRMFLGLPDPHPDLLVTSKDPDPSIIKQK